MFEYRIVGNKREKEELAIYYSNLRKELEKMREEFDEIKESKYNNNIIRRTKQYYYRILVKDINSRPEFIEPIKNVFK